MLNSKQVKCIELMIRGGMKYGEIAKELNIKQASISRWKQDAEFVAEFDAQMKQAIQSTAGRAFKTMESLLDSPIDNVRYSAAKDIMDRAGYKPSDFVEMKVNTSTKLSEVIGQLNGG